MAQLCTYTSLSVEKASPRTNCFWSARMRIAKELFPHHDTVDRQETWQEVLSTEDEEQRLARLEGYNLYVDTVEAQLAREIAALQEHSTEFFQASSFLQVAPKSPLSPTVHAKWLGQASRSSAYIKVPAHREQFQCHNDNCDGRHEVSGRIAESCLHSYGCEPLNRSHVARSVQSAMLIPLSHLNAACRHRT